MAAPLPPHPPTHTHKQENSAHLGLSQEAKERKTILQNKMAGCNLVETPQRCTSWDRLNSYTICLAKLGNAIKVDEFVQPRVYLFILLVHCRGSFAGQDLERTTSQSPQLHKDIK